jgi:hypothetical protein
MTTWTTTMRELPDAYRLLGGRGLTSRVIAEQVPPRCHPLDPDNVLVIAPGLLAGTKASSCSRLSIGAKSPLTNTIKESNAGGISAGKLARMGLAAITIGVKPDQVHVFALAIAEHGELIQKPVTVLENRWHRHGFNEEDALDLPGLGCLRPGGGQGECYKAQEKKMPRVSFPLTSNHSPLPAEE